MNEEELSPSLVELCKKLPIEYQKILPISILFDPNPEKMKKKLKVAKILIGKEKTSPSEIIKKIFGLTKNPTEKSVFEQLNPKTENKEPEILSETVLKIFFTKTAKQRNHEKYSRGHYKLI
jgi:hypothetical protein